MFTADALLAPISDAAPCGADLAFSPELDAIARARQFDDPSLAQGEWVTDLKEADWGFVVDRCARLLAEQTKDLRLAVWLTEAAAKRHHLRGLGEGFRVLAGLCERYWDLGLYPEADGGDQEQRIGNLAWILSRTRALVREMPLTEGRGTAYSTVDFEAARRRAWPTWKRQNAATPAPSSRACARTRKTAWTRSRNWNARPTLAWARTVPAFRRRAKPCRRCCT
ncbi:type VI secretion system protein TssA, partial [Massilia sp. CT11-108]|uniref:type VI secretion system protein TssA n=1 Tax=Massilia sp. CT11-108 TaxID=3393900 RepID=UPI0039A6ADCC